MYAQHLLLVYGYSHCFDISLLNIGAYGDLGFIPYYRGRKCLPSLLLSSGYVVIAENPYRTLSATRLSVETVFTHINVYMMIPCKNNLITDSSLWCLDCPSYYEQVSLPSKQLGRKHNIYIALSCPRRIRWVDGCINVIQMICAHACLCFVRSQCLLIESWRRTYFNLNTII